MLYDDITISCHEIMRSHHQMKAQGHQGSFQATRSPAQATAATQRQTFGSEVEIGTYNQQENRRFQEETDPREREWDILQCGRHL